MAHIKYINDTDSDTGDDDGYCDGDEDYYVDDYDDCDCCTIS